MDKVKTRKKLRNAKKVIVFDMGGKEVVKVTDDAIGIEDGYGVKIFTHHRKKSKKPRK